MKTTREQHTGVPGEVRQKDTPNKRSGKRETPVKVSLKKRGAENYGEKRGKERQQQNNKANQPNKNTSPPSQIRKE